MSPFSIICIRTFTFDFKYLPFGGTRQLPNQPTSGLTDYGYTGQRNLDEDIGLMDYKARFYSPVLNRFIQPDSIVPNPYNPQMFNRFSYVGNNPINFNDPTGHCGSSFTLTGMINGTSGSGGICLGQNSKNSGGSFNGLVINSGGSVTISSISPNNNNNQSTPNSTIPSVIRLPEVPELPECNIVCDAPALPYAGPTNSGGSSNITPDFLGLWFDTSANWIDNSVFLFDHGVNGRGRYPFRLLNSFTFNPGLEAGIAISAQLIADSNNNLSPYQRIARAGLSGAQAVVVDLVTLPFIYATTAAGAGIGAPIDSPFLPFGEGIGAVTGYVVGSAAYNTVANQYIDNYIMPSVYSNLGLYDPNGN
ncbi:MAG: RHS repeat-associated core domain-containing protein [Anaerolineales bacterium]|nr:RHS repeat-associated core domain-containing protein [Anaerolineales bacterium]